jgi:hypothetical protein
MTDLPQSHKGFIMAAKTQTKTPEFITVSLEEKIAIADTLAKALKGKIHESVLYDQNHKAFGVVMNLRNPEGKRLQDKYGEEDGSHIANLVIRKLKEVAITADF